jgi:hypothetical protein
LQVLDYFLLTQQVWNNPAFSPRLIGGFTTQNTDAEWSDSRQGYAAVLLWNYYQETREPEYLERAVAAARATFAVAPWENWAHTGYRDEPGALTGFHWGSGSAMTSVEIMSPVLGDASIDLKRQSGVGFNTCSVHNVTIRAHSISFDLDAAPSLSVANIKFFGVDRNARYRILWNGHTSEEIRGEALARSGYSVRLLPGVVP